MSSKRDDGAWIAQLVFLILGLFTGGLIYQWQKRREEQKTSVPDILEYDDPAEIQKALPAKKPRYLQRPGCLIAYLIFAACAFLWVALSAGEGEGGAACFSFFLAVGAGYGAFWLWGKKKQYDQREPGAHIQARPPLDPEKVSVFTIRLPRKTDWQPDKAWRFIENMLRNLSARLTFQIVADERSIAWRIIDLRNELSPENTFVQSAIKAIYPDAVVERGTLEIPPYQKPFYRYVLKFEQAEDFVGPILYPEDLTFDPLTSVTQTMSMLRPGERIEYTLIVSCQAAWAGEVGRYMITQSSIHPLQFLSPGGMIGAAVTALGPEERQRVDRYIPADQKMLQKKLQQLLLQAFLLVQVDGPTPERVGELSTLDGYVWQFVRQPYNAVAWHEEPWPQSVKYVDSPAQDWNTSIWGIFNAWLTNKSREWTQLRLVLEPRELASLWHLPYKDFAAPTINWIRGKYVQVPRLMRGQQEGVCLGLNRYGGQDEPVYILDQDRVTHTLIIGKNGTGKSTLMHRLIHEDIARGRGVAVVDPHGGLVRNILQNSIPPEREDDVVVLDINNQIEGMHYPPPLNMLAIPAEVADEIKAGQIMAVLAKIYGDDFAHREMADTLNMALLTLQGQKETTSTIVDVVNLFEDLDYRERVLSHTDNLAVEHFWDRFDEGRQGQLTRPVFWRIRSFYSNNHLFPMLCHPHPLNIASLMAHKKIILMSLQAPEAKIRETERMLLGAILVSQIQMAAMSEAISEADRPYYLYIDETQNFVTSALPTMLSEARKYGLGLIMANQYLRQLTGPTLEAVRGNVGAMLFFEIGDQDAKIAEQYLKPQFDADDLIKLGKFRAAVGMRYKDENQPAFSLETLKPLEPETDEEKRAAKEREAYLRRKSAVAYTPMTHEEVMGWLRQRYSHHKTQLAPDGGEEKYTDPVE